MTTYMNPDFGAYLRTTPDILADYRKKTGEALADLPRLVADWRARSDVAARDSFSPAQVEKWLRDHPATDDQDLADCLIYANIWMAR